MNDGKINLRKLIYVIMVNQGKTANFYANDNEVASIT